MVRTQHFHYRGPGFDYLVPQAMGMAKKKKKERKKVKLISSTGSSTEAGTRPISHKLPTPLCLLHEVEAEGREMENRCVSCGD